MGIFDKFYSQNTESKKFLDYVSEMSDFELINNIKDEYMKIKGNSGKIPRMGIYGSFEFAGALLLWKYVKDDLYKHGINPKGEIMINLGDTIGCAFFCMPAGEWSDKIDKVINGANDILSYAEWSDVYNYLKENYASEIHKMEFNKGFYSISQEMEIYKNFVYIYNSLSDYNSILDYYSQQYLNIKSQIPFKISN